MAVESIGMETGVRRDTEVRRLARLITLLLAAGAAVAPLALARYLLAGVLDPAGIQPDFTCFWVAARAAVEGRAADLYDWALLKPMFDAALGLNFEGFLPWRYPPGALLFLSPFGLLPRQASHLAWALGTLVLLLLVVHRIVGWKGVLAAIAAPLTVLEVVMGQNGFATAALLGGALLLSERRPVLAGLLAGALSCKPQLFPLLALVILIRGGWRGAAAMAASCAALALGSVLAFGAESWVAFFRALGGNLASFDRGEVSLSAMQSLYALARTHGFGAGAAAVLHFALAAGALLALARLELGRAPVALRNAAVCAGTVLLTPHILIWDLTIVGIGMAFLASTFDEKEFPAGEAFALLLMACSTQIFLSLDVTVGYLDGIALLLLAARRARMAVEGKPRPALAA